jgi:MYXO-CTERM domain-containing protein
MKVGSVGLGAFVVLGGLLVSADPARACKPAQPNLHTVDPAQVGVDRTPPQLVEPTVAELRNNDNSDNGCASKCGGSDHSARLINLGTDDMTPTERIGYRVTLVAGEAPGLTASGDRAILGAGDGSLWVSWNGDDDFDFTIALIAVDAAGNESAPRTVRIFSGGGCSVGARRASGALQIALPALALVVAAARRRRRRPVDR